MKIFTLKFPMIYQTPDSDTSTEKNVHPIVKLTS